MVLFAYALLSRSGFRYFFFDGHRQMSFMVEVVVQHVARDVYRSSRVVVDTSL